MPLHPENRFIWRFPRNIMRSVFTVGTAAAIGQVLLMLYSFIIARWLGPEKYAVIVANYSICAISSILINLGLDTWFLRKEVKGLELRSVAGHVVVIKVLAGVLWGILIWSILPIIRPNIYFRTVLSIAVLNTIFEATTNVFYVVLFKDERFKVSSIIFLCDRILRLLSAFILILFSIDDIYLFISVRLIIDILFFAIAWVYARPILELKVKRFWKRIMADSVPYTASDAIKVVYQQADVNLVSLLTEDVNVISFFSVAINLINVIFAIIETLQNVFIPKLSKLFEKRSQKLIKSIIFTLAGFAGIGFFLWVGLSSFGGQIVNFTLGEAYSISGMYLDRLSSIFLIRSMTVGISIILISINLQKNRIIPQAVATGFKVVFGLILFTLMNIQGMLWVYILSEFVMLIGLLWVLSKWFLKIRNQEADLFHF